MDPTHRALRRISNRLLKVEHALNVAQTVAALLREQGTDDTYSAMRALDHASAKGIDVLEDIENRLDKLLKYEPWQKTKAGEA